MHKSNFENIYCLALVEEILFQRDRNPLKNWWHIWGYSTIYSYSRWNTLGIWLPFPKNLPPQKCDFLSVDIHFQETEDINEVEVYFLKKYPLFDISEIQIVEEKDIHIFPKIAKIWNWHKNNYLRKYLWEIQDDFLLLFLAGISKEEIEEHDYYFSFAESIDEVGCTYLLKSWKKNPEYIFSNIGIASYCLHQKRLVEAQKFFLQALQHDTNNPWFLWLYGILLTALGWKKIILAEEVMKKVAWLLPDTPWVYDWHGETLIRNGEYLTAIEVLDTYEELTLWKHRTFEPYMRKCEAYLQLWDIGNAERTYIENIHLYMGSWYAHRRDTLWWQIKALKEKLS